MEVICIFLAVGTGEKSRYSKRSSRTLKTDLCEMFVFRAVAGFLAGVKASHHSTDKESRDRLDLGVTSF